MSVLKDRLNHDHRKLVDEAAAIIENCLAEEAVALGAKEKGSVLRETAGLLREDTFRLLVVGRFKNGKSTLINALLGPIAGLDGPTISDRRIQFIKRMPATPALAEIHYADRPVVRAVFTEQAAKERGKAYEEWSLEDYRGVSIDTKDKDRYDHIDRFEVGVPSEVLKAGVRILDSPGIDEDLRRLTITRQAVLRSDAAIAVYKSDAFAGMEELRFMNDNFGEQTKVYEVANMHLDQNGEGWFSPEERETVWDRLRGEGGGGRMSDSDFNAAGVFFVDALAAEEGRLMGNASAEADSRIETFESALSDFLTGERQLVKLRVHTDRAEAEARDLITTAESLRDNMAEEKEVVTRKIEACEEQLGELDSRVRRVQQHLENRKREFEEVLDQQARDLVTRIRLDYPERLGEEEIPLLQSPVGFFKSVTNQDTLRAEVQDASDRVLRGIQSEWKAEAQAALGHVVDRLGADLEAEAAAMDEARREIRLSLASSHSVDASDQGPSRMEKTISAIGGLILTQNPVMVGAATTEGFRGVGRAFAAQAAILIPAAILGVNPLIAIPAALIGSAVFGPGFGLKRLQEKLKAAFAEKVIEHTQSAEGPREEILLKGRRQYTDLKDAVLASVSSVVQQERERVEAVRRTHSLDERQREAKIAEVEAHLAQVRVCLNNLADVLAHAESSVHQVTSPQTA